MPVPGAPATGFRRHAWLALSTGLVLLAPDWTPALSQGTLDCKATYGEVNYKIRRQASSSKWMQLSGDSSGVAGVRVSLTSGAGSGHQLKLANARSESAVYQIIDLGSITPNPVSVTVRGGPLLGVVTHPGSSPGLTATVTVCQEISPPPPPPSKPPAQESGLPLAAAFMRDRADYWANHAGVVGTVSEACIRLHDTYWTQGPDGKAYPTWHPPVAAASAQETCYFGHEHGDDPGLSPFYVDARYQAQRDQRVIPIPFGYANEVLAAQGGARHEDHFGHKIYRENFETAYGNSTSPAEVTGTGAVCTALLKLHQGTHSDDALTHHLHEAVAHIDCSALLTYAASRVHVTALVPLGRPGWFSNNCGPYRVPDQTGGTRGMGENNAPAGGHAHQGNPPVALGGPSRVVNLDSISEALLKDLVDGERIIPGAPCLRTYESPGSTKAGKLEFGHAANDTWVRPLMITDADGQNTRMFMKSYYSVFNPSRVFWIHDDTSIGARASVEACRTPPAGGPVAPSALCQKAIDQPGIGAYSVESPYNGTVRNVNFKSLQIGNDTGSTTIWTDVYGRTVSSTDPSRAIRQYVSMGNNGMAGLGVDATIAAPTTSPWQPSLKVCRLLSGPYPTLPVSDACYWDGNNDLLFSKEWWRDYRNPAHRIHAPN